jgi:carboxyl-terminal processing protease
MKNPGETMASKVKRSLSLFFKKPPILGMAVMIVVVAGLWVDVSNAVGDNDNFYTDIMRFDKVATKIHQNYVEDVDFKKLVDNGINGMISLLDPHTTYMGPEQFKELQIHIDGEFGGLGIQISIRDKVLTVQTPIAGTPASRAGIQSGDQIIKIDGKSTAGITVDQAVNKLRGEPGSKVTITIRRRGEDKDVDYPITREIIHIKAVPFSGVIDSSIGYIAFSQFSKNASEEVAKAIRALEKKNIKGLVLDLRQNPGGLLPQAIEVAGLFLKRGSIVVSTRGRTPDANHEFPSLDSPVLPVDIPLVVLVNYASASASEIVAGAIQDWDRGIIVGDTTFGKGSVQTPMELDETHHIKLTTAYYYTPAGRCINRPENAIRGALPGADDEEGTGDSTAQDTTKTGTNGQAKAKKDTTTYHTKSGRPVFGGGGIIPDTVVTLPIPNLVIRTMFGKDVFFRFANVEYPRLKRKNMIGEGNITVDAETMKNFYHFLDSTKFSYQSISQSRFDDFKRSSDLMKDTTKDTAKIRRSLPGEKPNWTAKETEELNKTASLIDTLLARESKRAVAENDADIKKYLREALQVRHFGQDDETIYRSRLAEDSQVKAAIGFLINKNAYGVLLKPRVAGKTAAENVKK